MFSVHIYNQCMYCMYNNYIKLYIYTYVHPCAECICMQVYDGVLEKKTSELYTFGSWSVCRDCLVLERGPRPWHTSVYWLVVLTHAILFKIQRWSSSSLSSSSGWWYTYKYPSEKYEFVSWDTIWWEINVPKPPTSHNNNNNNNNNNILFAFRTEQQNLVGYNLL